MRGEKRRKGTLKSQQEPEEAEEYGDRARAIAAAIEANASFATSNVAAWPDCLTWRPKSMFDLYYKLQRIVERWEWEDFAEMLRKPLPVTFRFVVGNATQAYRAEGEVILERWAANQNGTRKLGRVDGWQLNLDKHELRAANPGDEAAILREWLIRGTNAGMIVRQEVASMLPGTLIDVQPDSVVLDMCASPGSKTTQLVERLGPDGVVVANDADPMRCYTLVKRTASLGARSAALVVTCHGAQRMPLLPGGSGFDRIICDVPCTGDGTTRKHPEVFGRWEVALAMRQHPLQLQIAMRGAALLNVGGVMCFSTCSLNPIENESVVAELLRRCGGAVVLEEGAAEVATELAGGCAPGMETWTVLDFRLQRHASYDALLAAPEVPIGEKRMYTRSMWPPSAQDASRLKLSRCVRLLPHKSDSGGFFVAVLRKVRPLPVHPSPEWPRSSDPSMPEGDALGGTIDGQKEAPSGDARRCEVRHQYAPINPGTLSRVGAIRKKAKNVGKRLFSRSEAASRIVFMTGATEKCCVGPKNKLNVVHAGATVLRRQRRRQGGEDTWRVTEEGVTLLGTSKE